MHFKFFNLGVTVALGLGLAAGSGIARTANADSQHVAVTNANGNSGNAYGNSDHGNGKGNNGNGNGNGGSNQNSGGTSTGGTSTGNTPAVTYPPGSYAVKVAGSWSGQGYAIIGAKSVALSCGVLDSNGKAGQLNIPQMTIDPNNHFSGSGAVLGQTVSVAGRVEPGATNADGTGANWRMFARFNTPDGAGIGVIIGLH